MGGTCQFACGVKICDQYATNVCLRENVPLFSLHRFVVLSRAGFLPAPVVPFPLSVRLRTRRRRGKS